MLRQLDPSERGRRKRSREGWNPGASGAILRVESLLRMTTEDSGLARKEDPLVVRLEIAMVAPDGAPVTVRAVDDDELGRRAAELDSHESKLAGERLDLESRLAELDERAQRLGEAERELARREADSLAERERDDAEAERRAEELAERVADLTQELEEHRELAVKLEELRYELAERETDLALARRPNAKRVAEAEAALHERVQDLEQREAELDLREAEREADFELREERLEHREHDLAQLEERLRRKERELAGYVGQLQDELVRREAEWWEKLAGGDTIRH
jgi:chromosome segregation ATPase